MTHEIKPTTNNANCLSSFPLWRYIPFRTVQTRQKMYRSLQTNCLLIRTLNAPHNCPDCVPRDVCENLKLTHLPTPSFGSSVVLTVVPRALFGFRVPGSGGQTKRSTESCCTVCVCTVCVVVVFVRSQRTHTHNTCKHHPTNKQKKRRQKPTQKTYTQRSYPDE